MAETSGTRALLEEEDNYTFCVSCIEIGYMKAAETLCVKCDIYLCNGCVEKHQREESSKEQEIIDKEQERDTLNSSDALDKEQERDTLNSSDVLDDKPDECIERCVSHVKQVLEYYCEDHQKLCCTACIMLEHTTCSKTYIPTASDNIFKSQVYREFKADIQGFIKDSHDNQKKLEKTLKITQIEASDKLDDIRRQRQKVNAYFDKMEENMKRQCRQAYTDNENHLDDVMKQNKNLLEDLDKINVEMTTKQQNLQKRQVYVKLKQWQDLPTQYTQTLTYIKASDRVQSYRFEPSDNFKLQDNYFGHLILQPELVQIKQNKERTCDITDMTVLPNGTIALADYGNQAVKVMHPSRLQVTPELIYHTSCPVGLAKSSVNQFAVSSNDGKIIVIEVSSSILSFEHELYPPIFDKIIVNSLCYTEEGLIMANWDTHFKYVSDTHSVLRSKQTLSALKCFATCSRNETIYRTEKHHWSSRLGKVIKKRMEIFLALMNMNCFHYHAEWAYPVTVPSTFVTMKQTQSTY